MIERGEKTTILVDFSWLYYRAKFANQNLTYEIDGVTYATGTLHGVYESMKNLISKHENVKIMLVMDGDPVKQLAINPDYKGGREKRTPGGVVEFTKWDVVKPFAQLPQVEVWHHAKMEADESIAFFTQMKETTKEEESMLVLSSDGDLRQLIDSERGVYCIYRMEGEEHIWEDEEFVRTSGVKGLEGLEPKSIPLFLAITGDGSDNVHGIPRFRKKVAAKIANEFETIEKLEVYLRGETWKKSSMKGDFEKIDQNMKLVRDNYGIVLIDPLNIPEKKKMSDFNPVDFLSRYGCEKAAWWVGSQME